MIVTSGAEWSTTSGNRRSYSVGLDLDDLQSMVEEDVATWPKTKALKELNKRVEILVVKHVADEGGMSQEMAAQRIRKLSE